MRAAEPLPALNARPDGITVSGVSSGGYMAVQFHVAHSAKVSGAGVIAAGPYYCAQGSLFYAYYNCMRPGWWTPLPAPALLRTETDALAKSGRIDAAAHLANSRAWLFIGTSDRTVSRDVVEGLRTFYASYQAQVAMVSDKPAGHAMVTEDAGGACTTSESPFIVDCDYDAAGALLRHLLGALSPRSAQAEGRLLRFDQNAYADRDASAISMDETGFAYLPKTCAAERCRIHVAFHGCRQGAAEIGERFVREAGYNRWADTNRLIVLYPQATKRYSPFTFNPRGCWDWWGYTDAAYPTKSGVQIRAIWAMVNRLTSK